MKVEGGTEPLRPVEEVWILFLVYGKLLKDLEREKGRQEKERRGRENWSYVFNRLSLFLCE